MYLPARTAAVHTDAAWQVQLDCPDPWHPQVLAALAVAGIAVAASAPVGLAVGCGREVSPVVDQWSVDSLPHLLIAVRPYAVELGPWVAPGIGPCARCVEAEVLDAGSDPLDDVESSARTPTLPPLPRALLAMAAGAAARDVTMWERSEAPHTWQSSWRYDHAAAPTLRRWARHPYCGCSWFETG